MKIKRMVLFVFFIILFIKSLAYSQPPAPHNIPRITPQTIKALISKGIKYVFVDCSTFGNSHICGAIYISYTWCPPYGKERIKNIKIPKDYYIFCYCTWPDEADSARVADYFIRKGYKAFAVKGGLMALKKAGFPACPGLLKDIYKKRKRRR